MSTDVIPETESRSRRRDSQLRGDPKGPRGGRWWRLGLLTISAVAAVSVVAIAARSISNAMSSRESGPKLTHTIARDDLIVTVTEQGTLESSNNTESKC